MVARVALAVLALHMALAAAAPARPPAPVVTLDQARWTPLNPGRPDGPRIAVLNGDPATGPSDMLMIFGRMPAVMHTHGSDYRLVVIRGEMRHWAPGGEAEARPVGPGGYWFQPANQPHADACLSDECLMFISWSGPWDARRLPESAQ